MSKKSKTTKKPDSVKEEDGSRNENRSYSTTPKREATQRSKERTVDKRMPRSNSRDSEKPEAPWKNDWRFYAVTEQIAKDVGSIPFNQISGVPMTLGVQVKSTAPITDESQTHSLSVMALEYVNTPGITNLGVRSGLNMAATKLYTFTRHANSGAKVYEAADEMMYILAMAEIYGMYCECKRALGIAQLFSAENRNLPRTLLNACRIDADDLKENIAQYRGRLNLIAHAINSWKVPDYFKAFQRIAYTASNVFGDSDSIRGQYYVFVKANYRYWDTTSNPGGTQLTNKWFNFMGSPSDPATRTLGEYMDAIDECLDQLFLDTDSNTISGDIAKAFNEANMYLLFETDENYVVNPIMDEDVLSQIENSYSATANSQLGSSDSIPDVAEGFDITQSGQLLSFTPSFVYDGLNKSVNVNYKTRIFNSHKNDPDYRDTLEWTRLIACLNISSYSEDGVRFDVTACGLEMLVGFHIFSDPTTTVPQEVGQIIDKSSSNLRYLNSIAIVSQFDWHPLIYVYPNYVDPTDTTTVVNGDLKKYTVLQQDTISKIHDAANAAAFYADDLTQYANRSGNTK